MKKKQACAAVAVSPEVGGYEPTEKVLFPTAKTHNLLDNWRDMPFFKQIEKDRFSFNETMGKKFNLNFNDPDDNIFKPAKDAQIEIERGERANIVWEPIKSSI